MLLMLATDECELSVDFTNVSDGVTVAYSIRTLETTDECESRLQEL